MDKQDKQRDIAENNLSQLKEMYCFIEAISSLSFRERIAYEEHRLCISTGVPENIKLMSKEEFSQYKDKLKWPWWEPLVKPYIIIKDTIMTLLFIPKLIIVNIPSYIIKSIQNKFK